MNQSKTCSLCIKTIQDPYGHNPFPLCEVEDYESKCCDSCNVKYVIKARMLGLKLGWKNPQQAVNACRKFRESIAGK